MRILQVDSARTWRGGQNQVLLTAQGMKLRGNNVAIAACRDGVLESRSRTAGIDTGSVAFHGDLSPAAIFGLVREIRLRKPDIVHAHDAHALSAAMIAVRIAGAGALVAARRVDFSLRGVYSRFKYGQARRIIAASRAIASVLLRDGIPPERVRVVYEGVPDRQPVAGGRALLRGLGVPDNSFVIGNVAALTDHKDHVTLIEAARLVLKHRADVCFVIAGEGECRPILEQRLKESHLEDKVLLLGFRNDIDVILPACTLFCLSSHMEGLGTSLLDAMAFGLPIVATKAGGIPEAVEHGVTGLVVPVREPICLAEALLELLGDVERRNAMGKAGRASFEQHFVVDRMVENTLKVYEELVQNSPT
jgi:glycosyltransferase involved in cell wall biosynthesis